VRPAQRAKIVTAPRQRLEQRIFRLSDVAVRRRELRGAYPVGCAKTADVAKLRNLQAQKIEIAQTEQLRAMRDKPLEARAEHSIGLMRDRLRHDGETPVGLRIRASRSLHEQAAPRVRREIAAVLGEAAHEDDRAGLRIQGEHDHRAEGIPGAAQRQGAQSSGFAGAQEAARSFGGFAHESG